MRRFEALLAAHVATLQARYASASSQRLAAQNVPLFFRHLKRLRVRDVRAVHEEHVVSFLRDQARRETCYGAPPSPWTLCAYLTALRGFFGFLEQRRIILVNPARGVSLPAGRRLPRAMLSEPQARRMMSAPFPGTALGMRDRAVLELIYGTGIRLDECCRANLLDLDLAEGRLLVRNGKGRKDRVVPVLGRAQAALDAYLREARAALLQGAREEALFVIKGGRRLSAPALRLRVKQAARQAGVRATPHALRHACATHLLKGGADVRHVQEVLGHKSLETTALYTHVAIKDLREAIARAHPSERRVRASTKARPLATGPMPPCPRRRTRQGKVKSPLA